MIRLTSKPLSAAASAELARQQREVDGAGTFAEQVEKAQARWKSKKGGAAGKVAFAEIKQALIHMTVSIQACSHCEYSEGEDIEHIYPKALFPERAFVWDNYLLACKTCNTTFKRDGFAVFDPAGSDKPVYLTAQTPNPPPTADGLLLNPRSPQSPLDFLELDFTRMPLFLPKLGLSKRDAQRATYTCDLLKLNTRPELRDARQAARREFMGLLREYVQVKAATTMAELQAAVNEPNVVDPAYPMRRQQAALQAALRRAIKRHRHPAV